MPQGNQGQAFPLPSAGGAIAFENSGPENSGPKDGTRSFAYRLFGLTINSERHLPHLIPDDRGLPADVKISFGRLNLSSLGGESGLFPVDGGSVLLLPGVASYRISNGDHILVEPAPGASERNVDLYLLGSALGALLHQRGVLPLHANVIYVNGAAVAFLGHSGAGKSTLAAWFHDQGYPVLGDDICVVDTRQQSPMVSAGMPRLRLWREALERTGRQAGNYQMSFDNYEKFDVPTNLTPPSEPVRLAAIYLLEASQNSRSSVCELKGTQALDALVANTYRGSFLVDGQEKRRHLMQCVTLLGQVPIFRAARAWGLQHFASVAEGLREHAIGAVAGQRASSTST